MSTQVLMRSTAEYSSIILPACFNPSVRGSTALRYLFKTSIATKESFAETIAGVSSSISSSPASNGCVFGVVFGGRISVMLLRSTCGWAGYN